MRKSRTTRLGALAALVLVLAGCGSSNVIQVPRGAPRRCVSAAVQYRSFQRAFDSVLRDPADGSARARARSAAESLKATLAEFVPHANVDQQAALSQFRLELRDFQQQLNSVARGAVSTAKPVMVALGRQLTAIEPLVRTLCRR